MIVEPTTAPRYERPYRATLKRGLTTFGVIGVVNTGIDFLTFNALMATLDAVWANVSGYVVGVIVGWWLNRSYTFASVGNRRLGLGIFVSVNTLGLALTSATLFGAGLIGSDDRLWLNLTKVSAGIAIMILKFELLRRWVTAPQPP